MNPQWMTRLQKFFWAIGWAMLALVLINIGCEVYRYFSYEPGFLGEFFNKQPQFSLLTQLRVLCSGIANAFFAFLMSSVFAMIFQRTPPSAQAERFLILTCAGFVGEGLLTLYNWITGLSHLQFGNESWQIMTVMAYVLSVFTPLMSFIFAMTIYVLYKHFTRLITFESEVV